MGVDLLNIGYSGLAVSKKSLQTSGHNISNANTEGYSRQRVDQAANPPVGTGNHVMGTGAYVRGVNRVHDEHIEKRLHFSLSQNHYDKERQFQLEQVEEVFNEVNSEGLSKIINRFFNSFRELSTQPENNTVRSIVRENAKLIVQDFHRSRERLEKIIEGIDGRMELAVKEINNLLEHIKDLNINIVQLENTHGETGDLRDQRDKAIRSLSEYMEIQTYSDEKNRYVVNAVGVGSLVIGGKVNPLKIGNTPPEHAETYGQKDIYYAAKSSDPLSYKIQRGQLGALVEIRKDVARKLQDDLDYLAFNFIKTVNALHTKGFSNKKEVGPDGSSQQKSGIKFFEDIDSKYRASEYISLSGEIKDDVNNIVTALQPNSPGDNRIAIAISKLQHEKILHNGTTTFEEEYLKSVGGVGLMARKATFELEQSDGIMAQIKQIKERVSGVSIDEETANMVRFQHAYDAAARVLKVADEMFKTVLNIKQ